MPKNIIFCADGTWNGPGQDDHDDAAVSVAVGDVELIGWGIYGQVGRTAEVVRVRAAAAPAAMAELRQELALRVELEDLVILLAANPHAR